MADSHPRDRPVDTHQQHSTATFSRRSICCGVAVTALPLAAGCSSLLGGDPGEVTAFNDTDDTVSVTITVTNIPEETTVFSEMAEIDASQAAKFNDVFTSATRYRFDVEADTGLSDSYEWDLPSTDHYLYVTIHADAIEFEENEP